MELLFRSLFKSWKTTVTSVVGTLAFLSGQYGIVISPEQSQAIVVVLLLIIGFLAKDSDATHTEE